MANIIKPKRSNTASLVPTTSNLTSGEIGVNMADQKIYINNGTSVVQIGAGNLAGLGDTNITSPTNGQGLTYNSSTGKWVNSTATGSGDVVGPASATDNALVRFDATTGKLIQNGSITEDDNGNLAGVNGITFNTSPTSAPTATGSMFWDAGDGTPAVILDADVSLQLGQENVVKVYNGTGSTITNGSVVAVSGAQGQRPSVILADADAESTSAPTLGIATENIANGAEGFVTTFGVVRGLDTSAFTAGQPIYLSSTAGQFTATKPVAPQHIVALGWVIKVNASSGEIFVNINNGWELDELHNVLISTPASGNTLIYDASAGVWKNANLTQGTGITITNGAGSISIANAGVTSFSAGTTGLTPNSATTGAVTLAGTLAIGNGGTGQTTKTAAFDALSPLTTLGDTIYYDGADNVRLAGNTTTTRQFLRQTGTGTVSAAPAWDTVTKTDVGLSNVENTALSTWAGSSNITTLGTVTTGTWSATTIGVSKGGTGLTTIAALSIPVANTLNTYTTVTGTAGQSVRVNAGGTAWEAYTPTTGTVTSVAALTLGTTGTDLSSTVANGTTTPVITLNVPTASATNRGALSSTDWSTFNGKQAAYTNLTSIGSLANAAGWLYNNGSGTFSYSTPTASNVGLGNVTNDTQTKAAIVPNTAPTSGQILVGNAGGTAYAPVSMSGDATLASTGAITLSTVNANVGSFTNASITVDAKGRITAASSGAGGGVTSFSAGTTGLTPSTATTGAITLAGTLVIANGGTGATTAATARTNLGATTVGSNIFTLTNPSAVTFPRFNADNTVSALDAATFRSAIGAGTSSTTGTVTSITAGTGLSGGTITTTGTIELANTAVTAGSYTNASITVDAQGRLTAASSGTAGGVGQTRAWVNFNGTGTVATRATGNVSSITDNGVGDYSINFTSALANANYAVAGVVKYRDTTGNYAAIMVEITDKVAISSAMKTSLVRIGTCANGGLYDCSVVCVTVTLA